MRAQLLFITMHFHALDALKGIQDTRLRSSIACFASHPLFSTALHPMPLCDITYIYTIHFIVLPQSEYQ